MSHTVMTHYGIIMHFTPGNNNAKIQSTGARKGALAWFPILHFSKVRYFPVSGQTSGADLLSETWQPP
jgi:hypothetical protein